MIRRPSFRRNLKTSSAHQPMPKPQPRLLPLDGMMDVDMSMDDPQPAEGASDEEASSDESEDDGSPMQESYDDSQRPVESQDSILKNWIQNNTSAINTLSDNIINLFKQPPTSKQDQQFSPFGSLARRDLESPHSHLSPSTSSLRSTLQPAERRQVYECRSCSKTFVKNCDLK
jgi:hypothetical protein